MCTCAKCKKSTTERNSFDYMKDGDVVGRICRSCWQSSSKLELCEECGIVYHVNENCLCDEVGVCDNEEIDFLSPDELYAAMGHV